MSNTTRPERTNHTDTSYEAIVLTLIRAIGRPGWQTSWTYSSLEVLTLDLFEIHQVCEAVRDVAPELDLESFSDDPALLSVAEIAHLCAQHHVVQTGTTRVV